MAKIHSIWIGFVVLPVVGTLVAAGGCSMPKASDFKPSKLFSLGDDDEAEKGIPLRMVGTWTDTVLTQQGQKAQRGFGGRILFYGKDDEQPILVDGELVVYAFDETNRAVTDNKPTRRYVFPADQVARHMSKSEFGASYSFWLPWDEAGGPQTEVSLICRFQPVGGAVITSEQTRHRLPGTMAPGTTTADGRPAPPKLPDGVPSRPAQPTLESVQESRTYDRNLQLASYESPVSNNSYTVSTAGAVPPPQLELPSQMTTTSIALPPNYQLPMGSVAAGPIPIQGSGIPQAAVPQHAALPQQQQPVINQLVPAQQPLPAAINGLPASHVPVHHPRFGAFPAQAPGMPTVATPTFNSPAIATPMMSTPTVAAPATYSPTTGGFGFGHAAASQPQPFPAPSPQPPALQGSMPQLPRTANLQMHAWNNVQTTTLQSVPGNSAQIPQQPMNGMPQSPQTIVQPASQPLPPRTGLTTSVSYSSPATAMR